jgi:hypothetical protein
MQSLGKLYSQPMGFDFGMRFALLGREIKKQQKLCDEVYLGILKKHGNTDPESKDRYNIPEANREAYAAELKKLNEHSFDVKINRFDAAKLSEVIKFSPQDLMLLEPLLLPLELPPETAVLKPVPASPPQPSAH